MWPPGGPIRTSAPAEYASCMAGIAQSFMNEIEKGKKTPSLEVFFRLCDVLDIQLFPDEP